MEFNWNKLISGIEWDLVVASLPKFRRKTPKIQENLVKELSMKAYLIITMQAF